MDFRIVKSLPNRHRHETDAVGRGLYATFTVYVHNLAIPLVT